MPWKEPLGLKLRRRVQKPLNKLLRSRRYYVAHYYGADFLLAPSSITALEVSARIFEYPELTSLISRCREIGVDTFIDAGANIGIYTCVMLANGAVPRAMLFEPDRVNRIQLRANLLLNGLLDRAEVHELGLGDRNAMLRLLPGTAVHSDYELADHGFSQIVEDDRPGAYEVEVARFDDRFSIKGRTLCIKVDVEHYECKLLAGMERTLRENRCVVQVESYARKSELMELMRSVGYEVMKDFTPNWVFESRRD